VTDTRQITPPGEHERGEGERGPGRPGGLAGPEDSTDADGSSARVPRRYLAATAAGLLAVAGLLWMIFGPDWEDMPGDEIGLHYGGGLIESASLKGVIAPGTANAFVGPGDDVYNYPVGQQTYQVSGEDGAQAAPIVVVTGDGIRMEISAQVYYTLNTSANALEAFHERIGFPNAAYINGGTGGWHATLETYLLPQLDRALDTVTLKYDWLVLRSDPEVRRTYEREVSLLVQELVNDATGGAYFCGSGWVPGESCEGLTVGVDRLKPMDGDLSTSIEAQQKARAAAQQEQEQLDARLAQEKTQLEAEREQQRLRNEKADLELESVRRQVEVLGVEGYLAKVRNDALREAIASGGVDFYVLPEGSEVQLPSE
jgi:hypothetical protein